MPPKTTTEPERLEIHILGAGKGESIVLRWPDNKWGVVDCYATSSGNPESNPTLRFLRDRGVKELEFLCLTHPHDDHFRGMSQILDGCVVKQFWRFAGLSARDLRHFTKYLIMDTERGEESDAIENANEFSRTMALVTERRQSGQLRQKTVTGHQQLYPYPLDSSARFQVWSFAPHGNQLGHYESILAASFTEDGKILARLPKASHNSVSVGLLVTFGQTRVLLGGDVEQAAWADIREEMQRGHLVAHAVKVSHHGSETGYIPGLWGDLAGGRKPIAVIAPYRRFRLPKMNAIEHIGGHVSKIMLTCEIDVDTTPGPVRSPLKSRMLLRAKFKTRPAPAECGCGRCTLIFDDAGNCIGSRCIAPAYEVHAG